MANKIRAGEFLIPVSMMLERPADVRAIMGQCLITHCEYKGYAGAYGYMAHCDAFEEVDPGILGLGVPKYTPAVTEGEVTWQQA